MGDEYLLSSSLAYAVASCPTELRLQKSPKGWRCTISLRFIVDNDGNPLGQPKTVAFGGVITDPEKVEERIYRAQRAILNPSSSPNSFLDSRESSSSTNEINFSHNYVSVLIEGPILTDLTLCDLPGSYLSLFDAVTPTNNSSQA